MPFCSNCGTQHGENGRFCQSCGAPITPTARAANSPPAPASGEPVLVIIPGLGQNNSAGSRDPFCLLVTTRRSIFARVTQQVSASASRLRQNANQGKGFFGRWKDQVAGPDIFLAYFSTLSPDQVLAESPQSYSVENPQIYQVRYKYYYGDEFPSEWHLEFQTAGGVLKFITTSDPEKLLIQAYPGRVVKQK